MPVELSDRSTMIRPSPFLPRRKSTSRSACVDIARPRLGEALTPVRLGADGGRLVEQRDQHGVAFDLRLERLRLVEVEHDARPVARLDHVEAAQRRLADFLRCVRAEPVGRVEESRARCAADC